jgi:hypothetical protein
MLSLWSWLDTLFLPFLPGLPHPSLTSLLLSARFPAFSAMARVLQGHTLAFAILFRPLGTRFSTRPAAWIQMSSKSPRQSSVRWKQQILSVIPTLPVYHGSIWFPNWMSLAAITADSTSHQARQVPLPSMLDLFDKLHCCKFFLCVDLVKEYHYIPMAAKGVKETTIISPFRLFEYFFMLFGLTSAAQSPKSHGQDTSPLTIHFHLPG